MEFWPLIQIVTIDALMAGDNAIVVGMAAARVPIDRRRKVIILGTVVAVVLRISFALIAVQLLKVVGLMLAGGLLLLYVAYDMYRELHQTGRSIESDTAGPAHDLSIVRAIGLIVAADISMSLDNVLAVAGAAAGNMPTLVLGLAVSVTLMAFAANALAGVIGRYRWVAWIGLLMITYVALSMIWSGGEAVFAATPLRF
jgi:YjbE family integral membrane protein